MSLPRRILCPTDLSASADRALEHALAWSRRAGAEIEVLHVLVERRGEDGRTAVKGVREAALELQRLLARHGAERRATQSVTRGPAVAPVIVEQARRSDVDLVVVGTHGERGFRSLLLGSVAEEVLRSAPCPVLAVPPRPVRPVLDAPRRILVPLDFGPGAAEALRCAKELAAPDGSLVLLHVIEEAVVPDFYYPLGRSLFLREPEARSRSAAALERLYWEAGGPDVPFEVRVVDGRAAIDIGRIAAETAADLVVMPTHGFATPDRLALGSTADKVLRSAPCPVLVHRPCGAESEVAPSAARDLRAAPVG